MPERKPKKKQTKRKIKRNSILKRYVALSLVALIIASGASLLLSSLINYSDVMSEAKKTVALASQEAEMVLMAYTYQDLVAGPNAQPYETMREEMQYIASVFNVGHVYIYGLNDDGNGFALRCAVAGDEDEDALFKENADIGADNDMFHGAQGEQDALKGKVSDEPEVTRGRLGTSITWYYPLMMYGTDKILVMRIDS